MFNYVSSLLLKVLHDCEPLLTVSITVSTKVYHLQDTQEEKVSVVVPWREPIEKKGHKIPLFHMEEIIFTPLGVVTY